MVKRGRTEEEGEGQEGEEGFYLPTYSAVPNEILVSLSGSNFLVKVKSISLILDPPSFLNITFWG